MRGRRFDHRPQSPKRAVQSTCSGRGAQCGGRLGPRHVAAAAKMQGVARRDGQELTIGTRDFIETHSDPADQQQVLPLWQ
jgi:hypothetical protein